jgi:hypothetical protein
MLPNGNIVNATVTALLDTKKPVFYWFVVLRVDVKLNFDVGKTIAVAYK